MVGAFNLIDILKTTVEIMNLDFPRIFLITSMLPSISIHDGIFLHCSLFELAEAFNCCSGIKGFSGTEVGLHLQKFRITSMEWSVEK